MTAFVDSPVITRRRLGLAINDAIPKIDPPKDVLLPATTGGMLLYKIHKANFVTYTVDVREVLDHLVGGYPRLAAKKDTHIGTFPLFYNPKCICISP